MKRKSQLKRIDPNEWDEKAGYEEGEKLARIVYERERGKDGYHTSKNLRIIEKGTLYEEGLIKGYEEIYEDLRMFNGQTWLEQYAEQYNEEYDYDDDDDYDYDDDDEYDDD